MKIKVSPQTLAGSSPARPTNLTGGGEMVNALPEGVGLSISYFPRKLSNSCERRRSNRAVRKLGERWFDSTPGRQSFMTRWPSGKAPVFNLTQHNLYGVDRLTERCRGAGYAPRQPSIPAVRAALHGCAVTYNSSAGGLVPVRSITSPITR